jgi:hypothetical protein
LAPSLRKYDAFSKVDGGGSGRGGDDRKIDASEWKAGWRGVTGHGFVALQRLTTEAAAQVAFQAMDGNGGGVVMLDEWCAYLKAAEVAAHTQVGQLLNADEDTGGGARTPAKAPKAIVVKAEKPAAAAGRNFNSSPASPDGSRPNGSARPQGAKRMSSSAGNGTAV